MTEPERREMVEGYLRRLERELEDVPAGARQELIEDVRSHITEAWESAAEHNRATLLNILERLGTPEVLAREERERLGIESEPLQKDADVLSIAAIVFTVVFWPLGVLLSWISSRWSPADKAVATMIPVLGLFLGLMMSMVLFTTTGQVQAVSTAVQGEPRQSTGSVPQPNRTEGIERNLRAFSGRALAFYGFLGAPLTSAAYLVLRLRRGTRHWASLIPAVVGMLAGVMLIVVFLSPADVSSRGVRTAPKSTSVPQQIQPVTP